MKISYTIFLCIIMLFTQCTTTMKTTYNQEIRRNFGQTAVEKADILLQKDIQHLPLPVQKYLHFTGVLGRQKVDHVFIRATGQIRSKPGDKWMNFTSEQYNWFGNPSRYFYITARKMGIPAKGLHVYKDGKASMVIKLANLFTVVNAYGPEMDKAETVTLLNDMCFMAPASLIDPRISWESIDSSKVKACFTNKNISISATLTFDSVGMLVNFISYDRYETADGKTFRNLPWKTPVKAYGMFHGLRLPAKAEAIYERPEGDFCYGIFHLHEIRTNP